MKRRKRATHPTAFACHGPSDARQAPDEQMESAICIGQNPAPGSELIFLAATA